MTLKELADECERTGLSTVQLRRLFSLLLEDHFSKPTNYVDYAAELQCLKYDPSDKKNQMVIGPAHTDKTTSSDPSVAVFVSVKQMLVEKLVMGNRAAFLPDFSGEVQVKKSRAHVVLSHKHPDSDVAMLMAESSMTYLEGMHRLVYKLIPGLLGYECVEISEVKLDREKPQERYRCDLSVKVEYQMLITIYEESHRLKKFGFEVTLS
jgi:hypothetical protein